MLNDIANGIQQRNIQRWQKVGGMSEPRWEANRQLADREMSRMATVFKDVVNRPTGPMRMLEQVSAQG